MKQGRKHIVIGCMLLGRGSNKLVEIAQGHSIIIDCSLLGNSLASIQLVIILAEPMDQRINPFLSSSPIGDEVL